ncbi:MAG: hypothetical protein DRG35_01425 [Deltaproteobacteria bacterium]|nr:MAG: hypothetical protein DRG35_01425 [Deltaproteobacteria bacterium]
MMKVSDPRPLSWWEAIIGVFIILIALVIYHTPGMLDAMSSSFKIVFSLAIFYLVILSEFKPVRCE